MGLFIRGSISCSLLRTEEDADRRTSRLHCRQRLVFIISAFNPQICNDAVHLPPETKPTSSDTGG